MSSGWVISIGCCIQLRGVIVSRPMPWTSLCCSELHRCFPVFLPVGQPGAPASSTRLPTWFVTGQKDVAILQPVYSLGEWQYSRSFATMLSGTYCNALRVLQERWHPAMSWTVLQFVSLANLLFERYTAYDSTGTVAIAKTFYRHKRFLHVSRWLRPYNGWLHLPYETRDVLPPIWFVVGDGMIGSRSLAFFASSLPSLAPPS